MAFAFEQLRACSEIVEVAPAPACAARPERSAPFATASDPVLCQNEID